ncbi:hypothetical protein LTR62_000345 [Meristemomyces frigidus]|uniref:Rhodopsin domain-containing protein n=1 Tax=Meristemomyces frigidus TaxID=1508187 RepID=A0AAN7TGJ2_9PEZI|nr:hypothetical protein LTR62_000345 [Meristemomyces frigidus]
MALAIREQTTLVLSSPTTSPDYSRWLLTATVIFMLWSVLMIAVRTWARWSRSLGSVLHDSLFAGTVVTAIAQDVTVYLAVSNGYGKLPSTDALAYSSKVLKFRYASQLLYVAVLGLSKCSTATFIGSLTRTNGQGKLSYYISAVIATWMVVSVIAFAILGDPLQSQTFQASSDIDGAETAQYHRWLVVEISGAVLEIVLWAYSTSLVWGLSMPLGRRLKVISVFGGRLFLLPLIATRLYLLQSASRTPNLYLADILTQALANYALMAECALCLKPFLQAFHDDFGLSTGVVGPYSSNPSRDPYSQLSNSGTTDSHIRSKTLGRPHVARLASQEEGEWVGEEVGQKRRRGGGRHGAKASPAVMFGDVGAGMGVDAACTAAGRAGAGNDHKDAWDDDVELLQLRNMHAGGGIQRRTTVVVASEAA